jgi:hypothetical protein
MSCAGDGSCLRQVDVGYMMPRTPCAHECRPVPCPNFIVCGVLLPVWLQARRCINCDITFGKNLSVHIVAAPKECPVCFDTMPVAVTYPSGCQHKFCCHCTRRLFGWPAEVSAEVLLSYTEQDEDGDDGDGDDGDGDDGDGDGDDGDGHDGDGHDGDGHDVAVDNDQVEEAPPGPPACPLCRSQHVPDWQMRARERSARERL